MKAFTLKSGTNKDVHSHHCYSAQFGSPSDSNERCKKNKRNADWKKKLLLFSDDMILTIHRKPKSGTRKLLELINEYSKVVGYKINTGKPLTFLYTNNEKSER